MKYNIARVTSLLFVLWLVAPAAAQQVIDNMLYTAGTTTADKQGRQWSYLFWQGTSADLLKGRTLAVYVKDGNANSANLYARKGVVRLQTDPGVLEVLLNRSVNLGEDLPTLHERLNNLFQKLLPPSDASLALKLSIVIRSSLEDPNHFQNLLLISRVHPGVALGLGFAFAEQIPNAGEFTYEVREYDPAKGMDIAVVGRVTVAAGSPIILPPPGAPVVVPNVPVSSAKGDLNARFRWSTPDELRRMELMSYGFNLYRMTRAFAEANNFHNLPLPGSLLANLAADHAGNSTNPPVKRVNQTPIMKSKQFGSADVANFDPNTGGDNTTAFAHDDNGRYQAGGIPFQNGDQFYYFITARDLLGRDGKASPATLVTMCDRLPPEAPSGVKVENHYSKLQGQLPKQVLKIDWKQNVNTDSETHIQYLVYRWNNHSDYLKDTLPPFPHPNLVGALPHDPNGETLTLLDSGLNAPQMPQDASKTFWYTVRVQDGSACGGNFSSHSGPVFGVLRDRVGPDGPSGSIGINCCEPHVEKDKNLNVAFPNSDPALAYFRLICQRAHPAIQWAEFYALETTNLLGRVDFVNGLSKVHTEYSIGRQELGEKQATFYCRVGTTDGKVSALAAHTAATPPVGAIRDTIFNADLNCRPVSITADAAPCVVHTPDPSGNGPYDCVDIFLNLAGGTKEIKLYRRVDFGPLTLIEQTKATNSQVQLKDCVPLAISADVCYFAQAFDEHGNASQMSPIGQCFKFKGVSKLPKVMLSPLSPDGSTNSPYMDLRWFCPPYGIERFEISIAVEGPDLMPAEVSSMLSTNVRVDENIHFTIRKQSKIDHFSVYRTPAINANFGEGAKFRVTVGPIQLNRRYFAFVRPIGKDGSVGPRGNVEDFQWSPLIYQAPQVPWPDRPMGGIGQAFHPLMVATNLPTDQYPAGIRIGEKLPVVSYTQPTNGYAILQDFTNPIDYLFTKQSGDTVLPVALYRYQVKNDNFPVPSGDVTQVSPLMEKIAFQKTNIGQFGSVTIVRDPFVEIRPRGGGDLEARVYDIYLRDTQPVISGARYGYLLVRFGPDREILEVIPTNEVEL